MDGTDRGWRDGWIYMCTCVYVRIARVRDPACMRVTLCAMME